MQSSLVLWCRLPTTSLSTSLAASFCKTILWALNVKRFLVSRSKQHIRATKVSTSLLHTKSFKLVLSGSVGNLVILLIWLDWRRTCLVKEQPITSMQRGSILILSLGLHHRNGRVAWMQPYLLQRMESHYLWVFWAHISTMSAIFWMLSEMEGSGLLTHKYNQALLDGYIKRGLRGIYWYSRLMFCKLWPGRSSTTSSANCPSGFCLASKIILSTFSEHSRKVFSQSHG